MKTFWPIAQQIAEPLATKVKLADVSVMAHHSPRLFPWSKHVLNSKAKEWSECAAIQPQGLLVQPVLKGHYYIRVQLLSHYTMLLWTILFRYTLRGTSQVSDHYFNKSY